MHPAPRKPFVSLRQGQGYAASGQSLIQTLKSSTRLPILPVKPLGDKVAGAHAWAPLVESGRVYLPDQSSWLRDFINEVTSFPAAPHDDQVDAMSQALGYMRESPYEPFRYSGLLRYQHEPWSRQSADFKVRDGCAAQDALDDMAGDSTFFVRDASQMRFAPSTPNPGRWRSLGRRRAWG